jgi:hypothetical protein
MSCRLFLIPLLALALALAAACGGGAGGLSPQAIVSDAATKSEEAGSSRVDLELTMSGFAPGELTIAGEGVQDSEQQLARFTFDLSEISALTGGGVDLSEIEMVMAGSSLYIRLPFLESAGLKPWVEIDLQKVGKEKGLDLPALQQLGQADPALTFAFLRAAGDDTEEVGEEEVRGVQTTQYKTTVDLDRAAEQASAEQRAAIQALKEDTGLEVVPVNAWIDDDGLVRRIDFDYEDVELQPGKRGDMALRMEFYDYGADVNVEQPPPDEVMSFDELLQQGGQS